MSIFASAICFLKHVLVEIELKKLQTFDLSLFIGQSYFNNDGGQLYLIFQQIYKSITAFSGLKDKISEWESKGLSNENFKSPYMTIKMFLQSWYA